MDTRSPVRLGIVGCGWHGTTMATAVLGCEPLLLVAGADPDRAAVRRVADLTDGVAAFRSVEELLASADVDAVLIATPHDVLAPAALTAIRAGKHVLIEKPMALDEEQAKEVEFAAASAGVTCMVGYSFRYGMGRYVQEAYTSGAIGDLVAISGSIWLSGLDDGWPAVHASGGGPLLYVGCHLLDLILWLTDTEPVAVSAVVRRIPDTGVDDTSAIQLDFGDGRVAQLLVTQSCAGFGYDLHVLGSAGSISLHGKDFRHYEVVLRRTSDEPGSGPSTSRPAADGEPNDTMFGPELADFADAIEQGRSPGVTASDGRRVLRVLDAVAESGRTGKPIGLDTPMLAAY